MPERHVVTCLGCGVTLPDEGLPMSDRHQASGKCWRLFGELTVFNIERSHPTFPRYTGAQVQKAHMRMAARRREWPRFDLPARPAAATVLDVMKVPAVEQRDLMVRRWAAAVWASWQHGHAEVRSLYRELLGVDGFRKPFASNAMLIAHTQGFIRRPVADTARRWPPPVNVWASHNAEQIW
ncbi:MAG TPA: DUF5946 family protein [Bacillota bacterium]